VDLEFRVQIKGLGFRGLRFRVTVWGYRFLVQDLEFRVKGRGLQF
jgi:hypothetical protein